MTIKVLFVCMGNICRSPSAQGIFEHLTFKSNNKFSFEIDSAGTHSYHTGSPPDHRAQEATIRYGIDISGQRARVFTKDDYYYYNYIIAMDLDNFNILINNSPKECVAKIHKLLDFLPDNSLSSVPDPYFVNNFDLVYKLIYKANCALLSSITNSHKIP